MAQQELSQFLVERCDEVSSVLKSLSHPTRLKVLCVLLDQERGVNDLTQFCGISQSAMSQFLDRMKKEGLLQSRREGTRMIYSLVDPRVVRLLRAVKGIYC